MNVDANDQRYVFYSQILSDIKKPKQVTMKVEKDTPTKSESARSKAKSSGTKEKSGNKDTPASKRTSASKNSDHLAEKMAGIYRGQKESKFNEKAI
jgi:hypothetical protein